MGATQMDAYKKMSEEMFKSVGQAIGVHVLLLVMEHAVWQTKQKYEEASLIQCSEDGISLDSLKDLEPELAKQVAYDFIMAMVATLGRLVGKQLAYQLTEQLHVGKGEELSQ